MRDWIAKLDSFLTHADMVLTSAGKLSHELTVEGAGAQYALFRAQQAPLPSSAERNFESAIAKTKQLEETLGKAKGNSRSSRGKEP